MCYSADDLLPVCEELGIPLVVSVPSNRVSLSSLKRKKFDYHHNWINVGQTFRILSAADILIA